MDETGVSKVGRPGTSAPSVIIWMCGTLALGAVLARAQYIARGFGVMEIQTNNVQDLVASQPLWLLWLVVAATLAVPAAALAVMGRRRPIAVMIALAVSFTIAAGAAYYLLVAVPVASVLA